VRLLSQVHLALFAEISTPLTDLLKDGQWRSPSAPDVLADVESLKAALVSRPVLTYFDVHAAATDLYCDASGDNIGVVLQQTDQVGLRDDCLYFRYQLLGVPFTVRTDHSSLRWLYLNQN
jgi:hypothetical protein